MLLHHVQIGQPAVEDDLQLREIGLELLDHVIAQRRYIAVLLRRQPFEYGDARMHDKGIAPGSVYLTDEVAELGIAVVAIDADPMLDRHRQAAGLMHGIHTLGYQGRMGHQTGTDHVVLHPVARTAHVQIDLGKACVLGQRRTGRQLPRIATAQLQRQGLLRRIEAEKA